MLSDVYNCQVKHNDGIPKITHKLWLKNEDQSTSSKIFYVFRVKFKLISHILILLTEANSPFFILATSVFSSL